MRLWLCPCTPTLSVLFSASPRVVSAAMSAQRSLQWQHTSYRAYMAGSQMPISAAFNCLQSSTFSAVFSVARPNKVPSTPPSKPNPVSINSLLIGFNHVHSCRIHSLSDQPAESQPGIKGVIPKPSLNTRDRITGYLRESLLLSYTALFDNVIFRAFELLRLDRILKWLTPNLEDGYGRITGTVFVLLLNPTCMSPDAMHS